MRLSLSTKAAALDRLATRKGFTPVTVSSLEHAAELSVFDPDRARRRLTILAQRIKHLIDEESYLGYRMVSATLAARESSSIVKPCSGL